VDQSSDSLAVALHDRGDSLAGTFGQLHRPAICSCIAPLAGEPIREIQRRIAERVPECITKISVLRASLQLDDELRDGAAREPPLEQHSEHCHGNGCEDTRSRPRWQWAQRLPDDVGDDRERERPEHCAACPEQRRGCAALRSTRSTPAVEQQHDGDEREHDAKHALALQDDFRELVVARDLKCVLGAIRAEHRRVAQEQIRDLENRCKHDRGREEQPLETTLQAAAGEREHEKDEAEEVEVLDDRPNREDCGVVAIGQKRQEPREPNGDQHGPCPVLGAVTPGDKPTADVRPPDEKREQRRGPCRVRLAVTLHDECYDRHSADRSNRDDDPVTEVGPHWLPFGLMARRDGVHGLHNGMSLSRVAAERQPVSRTPTK
jgi:hypothetical protein